MQLLLAGVSIHVFAGRCFHALVGWLSTDSPPERMELLITGGAFLTGLLLAVLFRRSSPRNRWPWIAMGGYLLFQWISLAVEHWLEAPMDHADLTLLPAAGLAWLLWMAFKTAVVHDHSTVKVEAHEVLPPIKGNATLRRIVEARETVKANSLIMFLSQLHRVPEGKGMPRTPGRRVLPKEAFASPDSLLNALPRECGFHDELSLACLEDCNWHMPVRAIYAHVSAYPQNRNLEVVLLPSADSIIPPETDLRRGSHAEVAGFRRLVDSLASHGAFKVQVTVAPGCEDGVDYGDLSKISDAVYAAKTYLKHKNPADLIIMDITGGTATCSAAGAVFTLEPNERIQYVGTGDSGVKLYDLEYEGPHLPLEG